MSKRQLECFARCASGFEPVLAEELRGLGVGRIRMQNGSVAFFGTLRDAYRACLWSRVATRVQLVLARIPAFDADELYENTIAFAWEDHVREGATIAIKAHGTNDNLRNTQFTALKVKDALCDRLRTVRGERPDVDGKRPDFFVNVALHEKKATLCLDLSGETLHRRGYRQDGVQTEAPLKETLAAGILLAASWDTLASAGGTLIDPMCGSGTLAIEGALIAANMAPGLLRKRWGFGGWAQHNRSMWDELVEEARESGGHAFSSACIIAGDIDENAIEIAHANAERAGVSHLVRFYVDDAKNLARHLRSGTQNAPCLMTVNPPYGMRLLSEIELPEVHDALATAADALPEGSSVALITPDFGVDTALGRVPSQVISCHNGPIETWVRLFDLAKSTPLAHEVVSLSGKQISVRIADPGSAQFANRLRKVAKERARWGRKAGITCYRAYDADLPDYQVSVDLYQGAKAHEGQLFAVVEERPRPRSVDVQRAGRRFADAVALTAAVLDIPLRDVVQKPWVTDSRYERTRETQSATRTVHVSESGYTFKTDLMGATGKCLPLELRSIREFVASYAQDARFACLFAYGNASAVFAAGNGARDVAVVDASQERIDWVRDTLRANGFSENRCKTTCSDVRSWLLHEAKAHRSYDLVLCTPPARLATRGAKKPWELSRDLPGLLQQIDRVLAPEGRVALVFMSDGATPTFVADGLGPASPFMVEDVSEQMVPQDFERSRDHPRCFLLTRRLHM